MRATLAQARSFDRPVQLLLLNQLTINTAFYMLMPYLANHLAGGLGLAAWAVGLVLGMRNLSQQGMFLVGGTLADRLGYKRVIVAGCTLRTLGFALLAVVDTLPALLVASAATGFAGALFNPAVRAYLAHDAGERRVEAFAVFNVFYQAGILVGPLIGLALVAVDFRLVCLVAAALFLALTVLQTRALPERRPATRDGGPTGLRSVAGDWRVVLGNRAFLLFSAAMVGSYVLSFQVYLALPLEVHRVFGVDAAAGQAGVAALFAVSALVAIVGQVRLTAWAKARYSSAQAMVRGLVVMAASFVPLVISALLVGQGDANRGPTPPAATLTGAVAVLPVLACAVLLTVGTAVVFPFEMDTVVGLARDRLVATHYGLYNTFAGVGITVGNLGIGAVWDLAKRASLPVLPWMTLVIVGFACAFALRSVARAGHLDVPQAAAVDAPR